ncbi:MAG: hypothetical protein WA958_20260 [Tunicatimonas sp.]
MSTPRTTGMTMRIIHRYLGFFLVGIMAVYAISGVVLIFRNTDFLKRDKQVEKVLEPNLSAEAVGKQLKIKGLEVTRREGEVVYFEQGSYDRANGEAVYVTKKLPLVLDKMTKLHKANTNHPLFWLNIFFGFALLFFVVSAFWMFRPATSVFKKGLYFTLGGIVLTVMLLLV